MAVFLVVLAALSAGAYVFLARSAYETLEPLMALPEGQAAYSAALRRIAGTIALFDLPLAAVVGIAAYVLARVSIGPLLLARAREERFAADAAHELRTPLATIAALAQAAQSAEPPIASAALARITAVALEASGLLADLLTLVRDAPDASRLAEPVDLAVLMSKLVRDSQAHAGAIVLRVDVPADGAYVIGDVRALQQLLRNLLDNAIRHARSNVAVSIVADSRSIICSVEDDGSGVAAADRERIFDRFFKADSNAPGSGLGLAIARTIAERHGGTLTLDTPVRFVARLPRASE